MFVVLEETADKEDLVLFDKGCVVFKGDVRGYGGVCGVRKNDGISLI